MTKRPKPRPATTSSWDIYLARHTPAKWLGTVEAVDADAAIEQAVKQFDVRDPKTLIAVRRR
jgi:Ser/Thr protein kinase RdoA (MazF antagonist)